MILYILRDTEAAGGLFAAQGFEPTMEDERDVVVEVRKVLDFPEDVWESALAGGLPVDETMSNDPVWAEWWAEAEPVWSRDTEGASA